MGLLPGTRFEHDGAVLTPLGPRDKAWLERAVTVPRAAIDIRPWWIDSRWPLSAGTGTRDAVDGDPLAGAINDEELRAMDEALALLRNAIRANGWLGYPWREWAELVALRGSPDPCRPVCPGRPSGGPGSRRSDIGAARSRSSTRAGCCRSRDVQRTSDGRRMARWRSWPDGDAAATATRTPDGRPMSAERFLTEVAGDLVTGALHHQAGELRGTHDDVDASSGVEVAVLEGFCAVTGSGGAIRIESTTPRTAPGPSTSGGPSDRSRAHRPRRYPVASNRASSSARRSGRLCWRSVGASALRRAMVALILHNQPLELLAVARPRGSARRGRGPGRGSRHAAPAAPARPCPPRSTAGRRPRS